MRPLFTSVAAISALALAGCGSSPSPTRPAPSVELEPVGVLLEIARASSIGSLWEAPEDDAETIEDLLSDAADDERDELVWDLVRARLASLEEAYTGRSDLRSAVRDAIRARTRAVGEIRERRAEAERRAYEAAEAAERERERQDEELRRRARADVEAAHRERERQDEELRRRSRGDAEATERERERRNEEFRRWAREQSAEPDRERERERQDAEFRRRAEAANERRRRREAERKDEGHDDQDTGEKYRNDHGGEHGHEVVSPESSTHAGESRAKQSRRRMRERRRRRRERAAARHGRRGSSTAGRRSGQATRRAERAQRRERRRRTVDDRDDFDEYDDEGDGRDADHGLVEEEDREELEPFVQRERDARRQLRRAEATIDEEWEALGRLARRFAREDIPEELRARIEFALLWAAWRTGHDSAGELAESFAEEHPAAGDLLALAWMIRGEVAADEMLPEESLAAFRFGMNRLGEPIYAYSLWRSASVQRESGHDDDARESLLGVEQEGCAANAPELVRRLAYAAAAALGHGVRVDPDGITRPEPCPEPGERRESTDWRPAE